MVNVLDLVNSAGDAKEIELFSKLDYITNCFLAKNSNDSKNLVGENSFEYGWEGEMYYGTSFDFHDQTVPQKLWVYDKKSDVFMSYVREGKSVYPGEFSDRDFENIPNDFFRKIDSFYGELKSQAPFYRNIIG